MNYQAVVEKAEWTITSVDQTMRSRKSSSSQSSNGWKSIHQMLSQSCAELPCKSEKSGLFNKKRKMVPNSLKIVCTKNKKLSRLIVNLFPLDDGYSVMVYINGHAEESVKFAYDDYELLDYIDKEEIPPMLLDSIRDIKENFLHSGCIIAELRDYRIASGSDNYSTQFTLLKPTQQTLLNDVEEAVCEYTKTHQWNYDDCQMFESGFILGTSEPLCLDPSPTVAVIKNELIRRRNPLLSSSTQRHVRRNGPHARVLRRQRKCSRAPKVLALADFLKNRKPPPKKADLKLGMNKMDLWWKQPLELTYPTVPIDVMKYAKVYPRRPESAMNIELVQVQNVTFKSETLNRDMMSQISIYQSPSTMGYYGRLRSNKFVQSESMVQISHSLLFPLGTREMAINYLLQFQELFSEDGRRVVTVTTSRTPGVSNSKTEVPLQQQPWQIEQDTSAFSIGSINDIDIKHWEKLSLSSPNSKPEPTTMNLLPSATMASAAAAAAAATTVAAAAAANTSSTATPQQRQQAKAAAAAAVAAAASSASGQQTASQNMAMRMQQQKQQSQKMKQQHLQALQIAAKQHNLQQRQRQQQQQQQQQAQNNSNFEEKATNNNNNTMTLGPINLIEAAFQSADETTKAQFQRRKLTVVNPGGGLPMKNFQYVMKSRVVAAADPGSTVSTVGKSTTTTSKKVILLTQKRKLATSRPQQRRMSSQQQQQQQQDESTNNSQQQQHRQGSFDFLGTLVSSSSSSGANVLHISGGGNDHETEQVTPILNNINQSLISKNLLQTNKKNHRQQQQQMSAQQLSLQQQQTATVRGRRNSNIVNISTQQQQLQQQTTSLPQNTTIVRVPASLSNSNQQLSTTTLGLLTDGSGTKRLNPGTYTLDTSTSSSSQSGGTIMQISNQDGQQQLVYRSNSQPQQQQQQHNTFSSTSNNGTNLNYLQQQQQQQATIAIQQQQGGQTSGGQHIFTNIVPSNSSNQQSTGVQILRVATNGSSNNGQLQRMLRLASSQQQQQQQQLLLRTMSDDSGISTITPQQQQRLSVQQQQRTSNLSLAQRLQLNVGVNHSNVASNSNIQQQQQQQQQGNAGKRGKKRKQTID